MRKRICIILAVGRQYEFPLLDKVKGLLQSKDIEICVHFFRGRSVLEVLGIECEGPFLLVCDEYSMQAAEATDDDLDGIHIIGLASAPSNPAQVSLKRAYCSLDNLDVCLGPVADDMLKSEEELAG